MRIDYSKYADKVRFWKSVVESVKDFTGTSPPSVFVGKASYPKVFIGVLSPTQQHESASVLDSPETWYRERASIGQILEYRGQMVYSRFQTKSVKQNPGRLEEVVQEVAMSGKPADVEVNLREKPRFGFETNHWSTPIGSAGQVERMRLASNPYVERRVDYIVSDTDMKAASALIYLYRKGVEISRLQKMFSTGLLGLKFQRKFVPTRWSVTAVDDIIGKSLLKEVRQLPELGEHLLFHNEYLGNHYEILFIPGQYQYELVEVWNSPIGRTVGSDYEPNRGRTDYAGNTEGAFYAGRLGVVEQMLRMKKQASVLIVREILPSYDVPMGIWQMRETVRGAFENESERFSSIQDTLTKLGSRLMSGDAWKLKSNMLKNLREQKKISAFFNHFSRSFGNV
jgi:hypothetical protein